MSPTMSARSTPVNVAAGKLHGAGNGTVGDRALRFERARGGESGRGSGRRSIVGASRIGAEQVAVEAVPDILDRLAASSAAQRLPETRWLTRARTSQPAQGVGVVHWLGAMLARTFPVLSSARQ